MRNINVLGIVFPNQHDASLGGLTAHRALGSVPFGGRYRLIDFALSNMVNAGIDNISVIVRENYFSLMDHLGSGREWDLTRKNGGLNIIPPFARKDNKVYSGRVGALANILEYLRERKEKYIVMSDSHIAVNFDFKAMIEAHIASEADITIAYKEEKIPQALLDCDSISKGLYYTLDLNGDVVKGIKVNVKETDVQNFSMNMYVIERELLIDLVNTAFVRGQSYFERDVIIPHLDDLKVKAFKCEDYTVRLCDTKSYFDENMKLLDEDNLDGLFGARPVYTKIRDDNPTRYIKGAVVKNIMAADGCVIEGYVKDSVLFKGVKIGKGAIVKNCVLMQDTVVEPGANIENIITDKDVTISSYKEVKGTPSFPVYIAKGKTV